MHLIGVVTRKELFKRFEEADGEALETRLSEIAFADPEVAFADEPLRVVVERMAESGLTRLPVLDPQSERRLVGMISLNDLLHARTQNLEEERVRRESAADSHAVPALGKVIQCRIGRKAGSQRPYCDFNGE